MRKRERLSALRERPTVAAAEAALAAGILAEKAKQEAIAAAKLKQQTSEFGIGPEHVALEGLYAKGLVMNACDRVEFLVVLKASLFAGGARACMSSL